MIAAAAGVPEGSDGGESGSQRTGAALLAAIPPGVMDGWLASAGSGERPAAGGGGGGGESGGAGGDVEMSGGDAEVEGLPSYSEWLWGADNPGGGGGSG